jgi:hypothetical protein
LDSEFDQKSNERTFSVALLGNKRCLVNDFSVFLFEFDIIVKSYNVAVIGAILGLMYLLPKSEIGNLLKFIQISYGYRKNSKFLIAQV